MNGFFELLQVFIFILCPALCAIFGIVGFHLGKYFYPINRVKRLVKKEIAVFVNEHTVVCYKNDVIIIFELAYGNVGKRTFINWKVNFSLEKSELIIYYYSNVHKIEITEQALKRVQKWFNTLPDKVKYPPHNSLRVQGLLNHKEFITHFFYSSSDCLFVVDWNDKGVRIENPKITLSHSNFTVTIQNKDNTKIHFETTKNQWQNITDWYDNDLSGDFKVLYDA